MQTRRAALAEQAQTTCQPPSLVLVDIDNFKSINDNYGHDAGFCIQRQSGSLCAAAGSNSSVASVGPYRGGVRHHPA